MSYNADINRSDDENIIASGNHSISSSSTLTNDDHLFFSAAANSNYEIQMYIKLSCSSTTPDFKWAMTTLTSARWMGGGHYRDQDSGGFSGNIIPSRSGNTTTIPNIQINSSVDQMHLFIDLSYVTAGTSGTVYFRWAQNTSNATAVSRLIGSRMQVRLIGTNA